MGKRSNIRNSPRICDIDIIDFNSKNFSIGQNIQNVNQLKSLSILKNIRPDCYKIISISNNLVAKRNLFSRKDYEKFVFIEFNRNIKECLN